MTLRYTDDLKELVKLARERGLTDAEILRAVVANEYGDRARLEIVLKYAPHLGLSDSDARGLAVREGLLKR
jgi:hypothetical protein